MFTPSSPMGPSSPPSAPSGRPRNPALDQALLGAALSVLEASGYGGFTIEAVAKRAGTSKVTLYRRWNSAADLLLAVLAATGAATVPAPTDGPLSHDLNQFFGAAFGQLNGRLGLLLRSLVAEAQRDETFRTRFREVFIQSRRDALGSVLAAAQSRGEIAANADIGVLLDFIFGAMWYRLLVGHAPLDQDLVAGYAELLGRWRTPTAAGPSPNRRPIRGKSRKPRHRGN